MTKSNKARQIIDSLSGDVCEEPYGKIVSVEVSTLDTRDVQSDNGVFPRHMEAHPSVREVDFVTWDESLQFYMLDPDADTDGEDEGGLYWPVHPAPADRIEVAFQEASEVGEDNAGWCAWEYRWDARSNRMGLVNSNPVNSVEDLARLLDTEYETEVRIRPRNTHPQDWTGRVEDITFD